MKRYINRLGDGIRETVDEFDTESGETFRYMRQMLTEYRYGDPSAIYWLSCRACKDWTQ